MALKYFLLLLQLISSIAFAETLPPWAMKPPEDAEFIYSSGYGEDDSPARAEENAKNDAKKKLVERAGVYLSFNSIVTRDNSDVHYNSNLQVHSDLAWARGLELVDISVSPGFKIWVLLKIAKADFEKMKKEPASKTTNLVNLKIKSEPENAEIYLNGVARGATPKEILLPPGQIHLKLAKSGFETISKNLTLDASTDIEISETLEAKSGSVFVTTNPTDAVITWNGNRITSDTELSLQTGHYQMVVEKKGFETIKKEGTLGSSHPLKFSLALKERSQKRNVASNIETGTSSDYFSRVDYLSAKKKYKQAFAMADEYLRSSGDDRNYQLLRANILHEMKNYFGAYKAVQNVVNRDYSRRTSVDSYLCAYGADAALDRQADYNINKSEILNACLRREALQPTNPYIYLSKAGVEISRKQWANARNELRTAASLDHKYKSYLRSFCQKHYYEFVFSGEPCI